MTGQDAIANRATQLIEDATGEVVLVLGDDSLLTSELIDTLNALPSEVDLLIGAVTESLEVQIHDAVPTATTFISGLEWLRNGGDPHEKLVMGRLLLVDRSAILVSTLVPDSHEEKAIFGGGVPERPHRDGAPAAGTGPAPGTRSPGGVTSDAP